MNGYKAFYKGKTFELFESSALNAQRLAAKHFKAKHAYDVTVILCEKNGEQITHLPLF